MESLKSQATANDKDKHEYGIDRQADENKIQEIIVRGKIDGTPFEIVTHEKKHFIAYGTYRISEVTTDKESLIEIIDNKDWMLMQHMATAIAHSILTTQGKIVEPKEQEIRELEIGD